MYVSYAGELFLRMLKENFTPNNLILYRKMVLENLLFSYDCISL
jgi:hypothetical protein